MNEFGPYPYGLLMLAGILLSAFVWTRIVSGPQRHDFRLTIIYFSGLLGALLGAKLAFLLAEGWQFRHDTVALLSGRSITGGLLGGYAAVEIAKSIVRYPSATGDLFAIVVPMTLILGRVGCLWVGCCPGVECAAHWWTIADATGAHRWPAAAAELGFNASLLAWALAARRAGWQTGNRFHVYLIAYGVFRFGHEFLRDDQRWFGPLGGYHALALAIVVLGVWRYRVRRAAPSSAPTTLVAGPVQV